MKSIVLVALEAWNTFGFVNMWLADSIKEQMERCDV